MLSIFNKNSKQRVDESRDQKDFWWWEESIAPTIKTQRSSRSKDDLEIFRDYQRKSVGQA